MNATPSTPSSSARISASSVGVSLAEIDASCRIPLLVLFISAAVWLVIGSVFGVICSLKFHNPNFLADCSWLTYGRVRPAYINCLLYGFGIQSGLGVTLWLFCRLGGTMLAQPLLVTVGAKLWNLGVTVGIAGILGGGATGFENLEMPRYAALILFLAYLLIGVLAIITFHERRERPLFVSQWFLLAALFWFPWIYSTANLLLLAFPVRGVTQAVIAWWFSGNLQVVWFALVGLAAVLYFVPKLTQRELHSRYLALFTFWTLILFGTWSGIPVSAPVPAWIPSLSTVGTVLTIIPILSIALNIYGTLERRCSSLMSGFSLRFIAVGFISFLVVGLLNILGSLPQVSQVTDFTWFTAAKIQLNACGFFAMVMFGAIYYIVPRLFGLEFESEKFIRIHFWLATMGLVFVILPCALGGVVQGLKLRDSRVPFLDVARFTLLFLRISTLGDLLILLGNLTFVLNILGLVRRFYVGRAAAAYAAATAEIKTAGVGA
jgi:cytochrome c oxidase cbb3-type subunit 1